MPEIYMILGLGQVKAGKIANVCACLCVRERTCVWASQFPTQKVFEYVSQCWI